jgi:hypothetical protein
MFITRSLIWRVKLLQKEQRTKDRRILKALKNFILQCLRSTKTLFADFKKKAFRASKNH